MHRILGWSFEEDRSCSGYGPGHMTLLRHFTTGAIRARGLAVAETARRLAGQPGRMLDFPGMTADTAPRPAPG